MKLDVCGFCQVAIYLLVFLKEIAHPEKENRAVIYSVTLFQNIVLHVQTFGVGTLKKGGSKMSTSKTAGQKYW